MTIYTDTIQQMYVAYFNRPADVSGLANWEAYAAGKSLADLKKAISTEFAKSAEYTIVFQGMTTSQIVTKVYQNLLGREPDAPGLINWINHLADGSSTISSLVTDIIRDAGAGDVDTLANKLSAAKSFTASLDTVAKINAYSGAAANKVAADWLATVGQTAASLTAATGNLAGTVSNVIDNSGANVGSTFALTKGLDNVTGTGANDTILGSIDSANGGNAELNTLSGIDIINGGAGIDTLKVAHASGAITLGNLSNVEIVEIESADANGVTVNSSAISGMTDLKITKAAGVVQATAGASTDVSVSVKENGAGVLAHSVDGGKKVTVTVANAGSAAPDTVTIGNTAAAKGDVNVSVTGKAYDAATGNVSLGAINVTGGKTVTVTQKASSDAAKVAVDTGADTVTQGAVTVNANADTTAITVKQDATVAAKNAVNTTGGQTETTTVKFGILKAGDALTANGLTFTAKADMTAAEVASAFANMVNGLAVAGKDTQGSGLATKGTYTNAFATGAIANNAGFTAAAANGDTVVFTAARANQDAADLTFNLTNTSGNSVAPSLTTVQGKAHDATPTGGVMGVAAGAVTIAGGAAAAAVKTITVDGYSVNGSSITGTTSALDTLNLSNGGDFTVAAAAETLALNLKSVGSAQKAETLTTAAVGEARALLDLNNTATKTLNITSDGGNTVSLDLTGATGVTALNVSGTGVLDAKTSSVLGNVATIKVTGSAGLNLGATATTNVTSVDTTGTTGNVTVAISGTQATYAGGAGKDSVTITNANTAITKAVDLGAGDDTLTLNVTAGNVAVPTVDLKGGEGIDTLAMAAADAVALSASSTFAGKIDGFEKLSLTKATAAGTVNLANMDDIKYVVSANSDSVGGGAVKEVFTANFATSGAIVGADTIAFDGTTINLATNDTPAQIAQKVAAGAYTNWVVTGLNGTTVTFEAKNTGPVADATTGSFTITDVDATTASTVVTKTTDGTTTYTLNLTGLTLDTADTFAVGGSPLYTAGGDGVDTATIIAALIGGGGAQVIGGKNYVATSTGAGVLVLTTTDATAPATLAYTASDVAPSGGGFVAGAGDTVAVAKANGATEVFAAAFAGAGAIEDADTIVFDGVTITLSTGMTPTQIAAAVAAGVYNNWNAVVDGGTNTTVNFTAKTAGARADVAAGNFTFNNTTSATTKAAVAVNVTTQGDAAAVGAAALTIDKMANGGTLELTAAGAGAIVKVTDAATGTADVLNVVTKVHGDVGTVTAVDVETINLTINNQKTSFTGLGYNNADGVAVKAPDVSSTTLAVAGNANTTTINVAGAGDLVLNLTAADTKVNLVDASNATGVLTLDLSNQNGVAVTVKGGAAKDVLKASVGANAHADVLIGGAGADTLWTGSNGAKLTGGEGNDLFVAQAGSKEANTYSSIVDFQAGDVLKLNVTAGTAVTSFAKLSAVLNENTAQFSNFVDAAIAQATAGQSVWFQFKGNAYIVVDNVETGGASADVFQNAVDAVIELVGVDLANASYNSTYGTIALV